MTSEIYFYLALSFILMHEMDAIRCKEWRIFPGLSFLNDAVGFKVFMLLHIPLFTWIFYGVLGPDSIVWVRGLNIFFIVHLGLHLLFLMHKKNLFKDWIS